MKGEVDLYQVATLILGGGVGVAVIKLAADYSKMRTELAEFRKDYARDREEDEKRFSILERLVIFDRLPKLGEVGMAQRNSPWALPDIAERKKKLVPPHPILEAAFIKILQEPLPASNALLIHRVTEEAGMVLLEERCALWKKLAEDEHPMERFTFADYMALWVLCFREAERDQDGGKNVLTKMGSDVVRLFPEDHDDGA